MPIFTERVSDLLGCSPLIRVRISIGEELEQSLRRAQQALPQPVDLIAMVDTGSKFTFIQNSLARSMGLPAQGVTPLNTLGAPVVNSWRYEICVQFADRVRRPILAASSDLVGANFQCIIGRDLLSKAILIYDGPQETFTLAF